MSVCTIRLPVFEGPPDLLLYLVEKRELEPALVEVASVAAQYRVQLQAARQVDLDSASEVLLTVARLLALKARSLLPAAPGRAGASSPALAGGPQAEAESPAPAAQDVAAYRLFQERAAGLARLATAQAARFTRPATVFQAADGDSGPPALTDELSAWDVAAAFEQVMARSSRQGRVIAAELLSVRRRMAEVLRSLRSTGRALFSAMCRAARSRREIVVTFLALLELLRTRRITITQPEPFADLAIGVRQRRVRRPVAGP